MLTNHILMRLLTDRIAAGLQRQTITKCSSWAEKYRVMGKPYPGPWSFTHHPWTREIHDCQNELVVAQKSAQMGFTETCLNKTFFAIDIEGKSVLYVLPASTPDASDFSTARFDPALELSPHLRNLFTEVKNIHHKRAGSASLYIRGSRSRSQMKSVPAAIIIFDEYDEMNLDNVVLAMERVEGQQQQDKQIFKISTPTVENIGINVDFKHSTQEHYMFKCPHCGKFTQLIYPDCLVIIGDDPGSTDVEKSYLICKECKHILEHAAKQDFLKSKMDGGTGIWIPDYTNRTSRGFQIPQLYSLAAPPYKIAVKALLAKSNPADEQELYNSKCAMTHVVEGAKITDTYIANCTSNFKKMQQVPVGSLVTMGVDVGKWLHIEIDQWFFNKIGSDINLLATTKLIQELKVLNFEELDQLMLQFGVRFCVIDANPERRKALEFAQRFNGRVRMCFYGNNVNGKQIHLHSDEEHTLTVDRTSWLDLSLGRFKSKKILLPVDLSPEYKNHIKAPVRVYKKDSNGNTVGTYVTGNEDDHFSHARNYAEIALPLAVGVAQSQNVEGIL